MFQEPKENMVLISEQTGNLSKDLEILKKNQMEIMNLKL